MVGCHLQNQGGLQQGVWRCFQTKRSGDQTSQRKERPNKEDTRWPGACREGFYTGHERGREARAAVRSQRWRGSVWEVHQSWRAGETRRTSPDWWRFVTSDWRANRELSIWGYRGKFRASDMRKENRERWALPLAETFSFPRHLKWKAGYEALKWSKTHQHLTLRFRDFRAWWRLLLDRHGQIMGPSYQKFIWSGASKNSL